MALKIAIIPARGGSKRLPNKNIMLLANKPLIVWTIEAALDSHCFDHVYVSTDSEDIARVAKGIGAEVPFLRPNNLATDEATTNDVVEHLVKWIEENITSVSQVTILQPTSPLRGAHHIQEAMALYKNKNANAIVSVCELEYPYQYCNTLDSSLSLDGFINPKNHKRTQDLPRYYRLNGAIYVFDRSLVGKQSNLYGFNSFAYLMNTRDSVDIDNEFDFNYASFLIQFK
ncbi:cytidylyltransferase domain-containing protein [Aeromonas salmonicida]|uniref:acylneuraminate cytidylyltransferase family protein n=1 Tax=Aeromonas salmonicida TaxID=645 RepID=UPI0009BE0EA9|nr:acylneuraminate cytidylyltransferase family protein [Aeromonas salmonicida]RSM21312.1 acylneuraminate cytidylyltransferase family protein [Aeromonas salmonicida]